MGFQDAFSSNNNLKIIIASLVSKVARLPSDIINLLNVSSPLSALYTADEGLLITQDVRDAVHMRICRYLRGFRDPHPRHPRLEGIITEKMRDDTENDTTFRLRHFLLLVSGSPMLPASDVQHIKVSILFYCQQSDVYFLSCSRSHFVINILIVRLWTL
jgi:hypothetical protein